MIAPRFSCLLTLTVMPRLFHKRSGWLLLCKSKCLDFWVKVIKPRSKKPGMAWRRQYRTRHCCVENSPPMSAFSWKYLLLTLYVVCRHFIAFQSQTIHATQVWIELIPTRNCYSETTYFDYNFSNLTQWTCVTHNPDVDSWRFGITLALLTDSIAWKLDSSVKINNFERPDKNNWKSKLKIILSPRIASVPSVLTKNDFLSESTPSFCWAALNLFSCVWVRRCRPAGLDLRLRSTQRRAAGEGGGRGQTSLNPRTGGGLSQPRTGGGGGDFSPPLRSRELRNASRSGKRC